MDEKISVAAVLIHFERELLLEKDKEEKIITHLLICIGEGWTILKFDFLLVTFVWWDEVLKVKGKQREK